MFSTDNKSFLTECFFFVILPGFKLVYFALSMVYAWPRRIRTGEGRLGKLPLQHDVRHPSWSQSTGRILRSTQARTLFAPRLPRSACRYRQGRSP